MAAKSRRIAIVITAISLTTASPAAAAPGDLDPSFEDDGIVYTTFGRSAFATAVALQSDLKIVVAGIAGRRDVKFAVARYLADGSLDATFSDDGKLTTNIRLGGPDRASDVAIQPDGRIVVVGSTGRRGGQFAAARYNPDGSLDTSFSGNGIVVTNFTRRSDFPHDVAIQSDAKIVVAGVAREGFVVDGRFAVVRYTPQGVVDTSFSSNGKIMTNFTGGADGAFAMAIQADDKIVAAGRAELDGGRFALVRYNADGMRDPTFGVDGKVTSNFTRRDDVATGIALQPDGGIVLAGHGGGFRHHLFTLARYATDGDLDPTFSGDGWLRHDVPGFDIARAVALQADGKIVVSGAGLSVGASCEESMVVSRFASDGAIDTSFGDSGTVSLDFTVAQDAQDVLIQPDGKIVVGGGAKFCFSDAPFAVVRFLGS